MKKKYFLFPLLIAVLTLMSCGSSKKVVYFQNADEVSLEASRMLYDAKIMPKDLLSISVHTTDPQASAPFNLNSGQGTQGTGGANNGGYLVDNEGNIEFPILGKLHVSRLTKNQCQDMIAAKLKPYFLKEESPLVKVSMANYRVTVLGEVSSPGVVPVSAEKMSILEAIAESGDLTLYGKRNNILLIRENEFGEKTTHRLDLTDVNIVNSPYFYLQQNDIVYVEPSKNKSGSVVFGPATTMWLSLGTSLLSIVSLVVAITRR